MNQWIQQITAKSCSHKLFESCLLSSSCSPCFRSITMFVIVFTLSLYSTPLFHFLSHLCCCPVCHVSTAIHVTHVSLQAGSDSVCINLNPLILNHPLKLNHSSYLSTLTEGGHFHGSDASLTTKYRVILIILKKSYKMLMEI